MSATGGFPESEYRARLARAQRLMGQAGLDALLLTTEPDFRYFTGFLTRFWESPARPWFLVVPGSGDPVAVIPTIGAAPVARSWIGDIRTWQSPNPKDEGVSLLADALREAAGGGSGRIGLPSGPETHLRMPLDDFERLRAMLAPARLVGDAGILPALRMVKSEPEIDRIRAACAIAGRCFDRIAEIARPGVPLPEIFRRFQALALEEGADWVPYLAGGAGPRGYPDVISPAPERALEAGEVLMLDTGLVRDGYFCDFDRNFAIGRADPAAASAHERLIEAVEAGGRAARPGATAADLFQAMDRVLTGGRGGAESGRLGHGLGMQLTEWPSLTPGDRTVLKENMVLTLEPALATAPGSMLVHEENIVIRPGGVEFLSPRAGAALPVIAG